MYRKFCFLVSFLLLAFMATSASAIDPNGRLEWSTDIVDCNADSEPPGLVQYNVEISAALDGSGLDANGWLHDNDWVDSWLSDPNGAGDSNTPPGDCSGQAWISVEFGGKYNISQMRVWNFNENGNTSPGLKNVSIEYSTDGSNWTTLSALTTIPEAPGTPDAPNDIIVSFGNVEARYVVITANSTNGHYGVDPNRYGLAELAFEGKMDYATGYDPIDEIEAIPIDYGFHWRAGTDVNNLAGHDFFIGTDKTEVTNATTVSHPNVTYVNRDVNYYDTTLSNCTDYYWRVDEVNGPLTTTWTGDVLHMKTIGAGGTDANLVGHWKFDGDATDSSGYCGHGVLKGDANVTGISGVFGGGLYVDGDGDYVEIDNRFNFGATDKQSFVAWIKSDFTVTEDPADYWYVLGSAFQSGAIYACGWASDYLTAQFWASNSPYNKAISSTEHAVDGAWHMVVATYDGADVRIYLDGGDLDGSGALTGDLVNLYGKFIIGADGSRGITSFWKGWIDDVRVYDKVLSGSDVNTLYRTDPNIAWSPSPTGTAELDNVDMKVTLSWQPGDYAATHDVYINSGSGMTRISTGGAALTKDITAVLGKAYTWCVNEVNGATTWAGDVWSFEASNYVVVDNMESYFGERTAIGCLRSTWQDGYSDTPESSGANLYNVMDTAYLDGTQNKPNSVVRSHEYPYPPLGGNQMMIYDYNNTGSISFANIDPDTGVPKSTVTYSAPKFSEVRAFTTSQGDVNHLDVGKNWTAGGIKALTLSFHGDVDNAIDPNARMYIALQDDGGKVGVVYYDGDANDVRNTTAQALLSGIGSGWRRWHIELQDFNDAGVNLSDVNMMRIGFGSRSSPTDGGVGVICIDDIRLFPSRCVVAKNKPAGDITQGGAYAERCDCVVDDKDLELLTDNWLSQITSLEVGSQITDVNSSSELNGSWDHECADRSGLDVNGLLHDPNYERTWLSAKPYGHNTGNPAGASGEEWLLFTFNKVYEVNEMWIWNYNETGYTNIGLNQVTIHYSATGLSWDWRQLGGSHTFNQAAGTADMAHNDTVDFGDVKARYVVLTATSNHGNADYYGLSEVRFFANGCPFEIPDADVNNDCTVDFKDYASVADGWLDDEVLWP